MVKKFEIPKDRRYLMSRMGDISQLAGCKRYEFIDGKAKGVEAVDFKTGSGFNFTVLPGRGMDIAWAEYKGLPISYMSKTGITAPAFYEPEGLNWLRSFFAGLLTTCGLSNVGWPSKHESSILGEIKHGLHGRISNCPAENVCVKQGWEDDDFHMSVSGQMREAMLHEENMVIEREISTSLGAKAIKLSDRIENLGFEAKPLMLLYHINFGYPLLDQGSKIVCRSQNIETKHGQVSGDDFSEIQAPSRRAKEKVYFHDLTSNEDDTCFVAIVNKKLEFGAYIKFNKLQLPKFTQWKQLSEAEYVTGLEPGNCIPIGLDEWRNKGDIEILEPGERKNIDIEIGLLTDNEEISNFEKIIS